MSFLEILGILFLANVAIVAALAAWCLIYGDDEEYL